MDHFAFTKLVVADLDRSGTFYREVFGLKEQGRVTADIAGRRIDEIMYRTTAPGGGTFVLLRFEDLPEPSVDGVIPGFVTGDVAGVVERAAAAGGTVVQPPRDMPEHGVRVAFVTDLDGRLIEVVEMFGENP